MTRRSGFTIGAACLIVLTLGSVIVSLMVNPPTPDVPAAFGWFMLALVVGLALLLLRTRVIIDQDTLRVVVLRREPIEVSRRRVDAVAHRVITARLGWYTMVQPIVLLSDGTHLNLPLVEVALGRTASSRAMAHVAALEAWFDDD